MKTPKGRQRSLLPRRFAAGTALLLAASSLAACSGAGGGASASGTSITVLAVNNPQMEDLQKVTADTFTARTGITVNYTMLPENEERDKATQDVANSAGQFDVVNLGPYEVPIWGERGWLEPLDPYIAEDPDYDVDDIVPSIRSALTYDGSILAAPFATETTLTAYRKDLLDAKGLTMPDNPTWQEVLDIAKQVNDPAGNVAGICLRGLAGWGQNMAPFTDMLNTFGGAWFDEDWNSQVNAPEFRETMEFYKEAAQYGPPGQAGLGVSDCFNQFVSGSSAMFIDSSTAAPYFEDAAASTVAGKVGYVAMPIVKTAQSGWLWSWGWAMPSAAKNKDAAWQFVSWASGKDYATDVAGELGWSHYPGYNRTSINDNPEFIKANAGFVDVVENAIATADVDNPGVQKQPYSGIQYLSIPEWPDLGTTAGQQLQGVLAGSISVDDAIATISTAADEVSAAHKK
jgi:sorbitol/mannitol transport system substrate-binding protein